MTLVRVSVHHYHLRLHLFEESPQNTWRISWELRRPQNTWRISWKPSLLPFFLMVGNVSQHYWGEVTVESDMNFEDLKTLHEFPEKSFFYLFFLWWTLSVSTRRSYGGVGWELRRLHQIFILSTVCLVVATDVRSSGGVELTSEVWRQSLFRSDVRSFFSFFMSGVHFFLGNKTGKNTKRHDRHTHSRFTLLEGNSPKDARGV